MVNSSIAHTSLKLITYPLDKQKLEIENINWASKVLHPRIPSGNSDYSLLKSNRNYGSYFEEPDFLRGHCGNNNSNNNNG